MYELREEWWRAKWRRSFRLFSCNFIFVQCDFIYEVAVLCASYANDNWHEWIHKAIRHMHLNIVKITAYFYKHRHRPTHTHTHIDIQKNDRQIDIWPHLTIKNYRFAWNSLVLSVFSLFPSLSLSFPLSLSPAHSITFSHCKYSCFELHNITEQMQKEQKGKNYIATIIFGYNLFDVLSILFVQCYCYRCSTPCCCPVFISYNI